ncbi:MAG: hypothetical protein AAFP92_33080, partial [Bacteroidota bacterium]
MRFSVLEIFLIAVPILETLRIIILCRDMRKLALAKGEAPQKWMWYTALLWISVEGTVIGLWFFFMGFRNEEYFQDTKSHLSRSDELQ